jgi:dTDP-4-amino-4,6-dideoxygalactose transaminase
LGTIGHLGTLSFHATKNIHCGEGGALIVNHKAFIHRAEVIREKGTNRKEFLEGMVDKYTWVDIGSSYSMSELSVAFLYAQLQMIDEVNEKRRAIWNKYYTAFDSQQKIPPMSLPDHGSHNGHIFFIKTQDTADRASLIRFLQEEQIQAYFHYLPLHQSVAGKKYGVFRNEDTHTSIESSRLLRLPLHHLLTETDVEKVAESIFRFYKRSHPYVRV